MHLPDNSAYQLHVDVLGATLMSELDCAEKLAYMSLHDFAWG